MIALVLQIVGCVLVVVGVGLWSPPAAVVVLGGLVFLFGLAFERRDR